MAEIKISDKIVPFLVSKARYQMLRGGRGSGKSHSAALKMIFGLLGIDPYLDENGDLSFRKSTAHFRGVISRDIMENIRDGQYQDIIDLIKLYELEDRIVVGKSPYSFYCPETGFNIIAKATRQSRNDAKAKTKGIKDPTMIWVDELPDMEKDHFRKLAMSARKIGSHCQIICTHNTDISEEHWVRKEFYETKKENSFYLHGTYKDNIDNLLPSAIEDYESLKITSPEDYAVEVLGEWGAKKVVRPFATQYKQEKHRKECTLQPNRTIYLNVDFNLDPFAIGFAHIWEDKGGFHFHNFDEFSIDSGNLHEAAKQIKSKYGHLMHNFHVSGDYSGRARSMQSPSNESNYELLMRLLGLNIRQMELKPNPRHENSRSDVNFLLAHSEDFRVDPINSPLLERDFRIVEVDSNEKIIKSNRGNISQQADHLDRFRYLCNTRVVKEWIARKQQNIR